MATKFIITDWNNIDARIEEEYRALRSLNYALGLIEGDHGDELTGDAEALAYNLEELHDFTRMVMARLERTREMLHAMAIEGSYTEVMLRNLI